MNRPLSTQDLEAVLSGHRDALHARCVALLVLRGGLDFRTALRKYGIARSTLYSAKCSLESDFIGRSDHQEKDTNPNVSQHSESDAKFLSDYESLLSKAEYF